LTETDNLDGQKVNINSYGQGLQRHLIFTLIRLSSKYTDKRIERKKDFNPDFVLLLFEEPEAFLHPTQQEILNINLHTLASEENQQVIITTHSPTFASRNLEDIESIIRLDKSDAITFTYQLNSNALSELFDENLSMFKFFSEKSVDLAVPERIRNKIIHDNLGDPNADLCKKLEQESIKYFLWLDAERSALFFAKHVIICEGATEKVLLNHIVDNRWPCLKEKHIYFLDAMGKYGIHRYMNLFKHLGISHSVLIDSDQDRDVHALVNNFICSNKNSFTIGIHAFERDLEAFLEFPRAPRGDLKPVHALDCYKRGMINDEKLGELYDIISSFLCYQQSDNIGLAEG